MASEHEEMRDPYEDFEPGDRVKHSKFGEGLIIARSGTGPDTKFLVKFADEGEKRLVARYAKLKKVEIAPSGGAPQA